jgi:hypothetical protein
MQQHFADDEPFISALNFPLGYTGSVLTLISLKA